jgi:hypothetical protein
MDAHAHTPHMLQSGEGYYAGAPQQYSLRSSGSDARRTDSASTIMSPHLTRPASDKSSVYNKHRRHFRVASPRGQLLGNTNAGLPAVRVNLAARGPSLPRTPRTQSAANSQLQSHHTTPFGKVTPSPSSSQRLRPLRAGEGAEVQLDRFGDPIVLQSATRSLGRTSDDYRRPDALTDSRTVLQPCAHPPDRFTYICPAMDCRFVKFSTHMPRSLTCAQAAGLHRQQPSDRGPQQQLHMPAPEHPTATVHTPHGGAPEHGAPDRQSVTAVSERLCNALRRAEITTCTEGYPVAISCMIANTDFSRPISVQTGTQYLYQQCTQHTSTLCPQATACMYARSPTRILRSAYQLAAIKREVV